MKKSIFLSLLLMIFSVFIFSSCGQNPTFSGKFSQDEFVYSLNDEIDFQDALVLDGIEKQDVSISISGDIATASEDGFVMTRSGRGVVTAAKDDEIFASANLVVKGKFSAPQNLKLNTDGTISWDSVIAYFDGQIVSAQSYTVYINDSKTTANTNSITLEQNGHYTIRVKADGTGYVDDDEENGYSRIELDYFAMPKVTSVNLRSQDERISANSSMRLSWGMPEDAPNATYDVIFDGIKILSNSKLQETVLDFSHFDGGDEIAASIIAHNEDDDNYIPSSFDFTVTKLVDIHPEVTNGYVRWLGNADNYVVYVDNQPCGSIFDDGDFKACRLENISSGENEISVQAKGGKADETHFYADSKPASISVNKLQTPSVTPEFEDDRLIFNIQPDESNPRYSISINGSQEIKDAQDGKITYDLSGLPDGELNILINAIYRDGEDTTTINSDFYSTTLYKLKQIPSVSHRLDEANSVLVFDTPYWKDGVEVKYSISLNGQTLTGEQAIVTSNASQTQISIANLAQFVPQGYDYKFEITASVEGASNIVKAEKTISILSKVNTEQVEQENGSFAWNSLGENVSYVYSIFTSDKAQSTGEVYQNIKNQKTNDTKINETLEYGYYKIRIYAKAEKDSLGNQDYLDADFGNHIEDNYFEQWFVTTLQIASPELSLNVENYQLSFTRDPLANKYEIYLDGTLLQTYTSFSGELITVPLETTFEDDNGARKTYVIKVLASVGDDGDAVLHPDADESILNVVRLEQVTNFKLDGNPGDESLEVTVPSGAQYVIIKKGGSVANEDNESNISLKNDDGSFSISLQFKAQERVENTIYLDGKEKEFSFQRLTTPDMPSFYDGQLSYTDGDGEPIEKYYIQITLKLAPESGLRDVVYYPSPISTSSFDLNEYLVEMQNSDNAFKSEYLAAVNVDVQVLAYRLGEFESVYYLPSRISQAKTLSKLEPTTVSFNTQSLNLLWNGVGSQDTKYDIYIDGDPYKESFQGTTLDMNGYDFLQSGQAGTERLYRTIYVFAHDALSLTSVTSNTIKVRQLFAINSLQVDESQTYAYTIINGQDLGKVKNAMVGDKAQEMQGGLLRLELPESEQSKQYSIYLEAISEESVADVTYYYISSPVTNYTFHNLKNADGMFSQQTDKYVLPQFCSDFKGVEESPLSYTITISNNDGVIENGVKVLDDLTVSLTEGFLLALTPGTYKLEFDAQISPYTITAQNDDQTGAIGYYGKKHIQTIEKIEKLKPLEEYKYSVVEDESGDEISKRKDGGFRLEWPNVWGDTDVKFDIDTGNDMLNNLLKFLQIKKQHETWSVELGKQIAGLFFGGTAEFTVVVHADNQINANASKISIKKLYDVTGISLTNNAELQFEQVDGANKYYISIDLGDTNKIISIDSPQERIVTVSLLENFEDFAGSYTVKVFADDTTGAYLPAKNTCDISGYRLRGLKSITIDDGGKITLENSDEDISLKNIKFAAMYNGQIYDFEPIEEESGKTWTYSVAQFVEMIGEDGIEQGVVEQGFAVFEVYTKIDCEENGFDSAINSEGTEFRFKFEREENSGFEKLREVTIVEGKENEDEMTSFLVLKGTDEDLGKTGLLVEYRYYEAAEEGAEPVEKIEKVESDFVGYWVTTPQKAQYFSKTKPQDEGFSVQSCLALNIKDILSDKPEGKYTFYISKTYFRDSTFVYVGRSTVEFTKLPAAQEQFFRVTENKLSWSPVQADGVSGYSVNIFTREGDGYKLVSSKEVFSSTATSLANLITETNKDFYISIVTISTDKNYVCSNQTDLQKAQVMRYSPTSKLAIDENGNLTFDFDVKDFELFTDIKNNDGNMTNMASTIYRKTYLLPFTFQASNIAQKTVRLKFQKIDSPNEEYFVTMPAISLLKEIFKTATYQSGSAQVTYISRLQECANQNRGTEYYTAINALYQALSSYKSGFASKENLFDDYGEAVPAGEYKISVQQDGEGINTAVSSQGTLPSTYSEGVEAGVSGEPTIQVDYDSANNLYYLAFKKTKVASEKTIYADATKYVINFSAEGQDYQFSIENASDKWTLYSAGKEHNIELTSKACNFAEDYLIINLSQLARELESGNFALSGNVNSPEYKVQVYATGNNFALNSKTDIATVKFSKFNYQSLRLENGDLTWQSNSTTRINYDKTPYTVQTKYVTNYVSDGYQQLDLSGETAGAGEYKYIEFMANGEIDQALKRVQVNSLIYRFEHLYKRYSPAVEVENGLFKISNNPDEDAAKANFTEFIISNNKSGETTLFPSTSSSQQSVEYLPGRAEGEREATVFSFASSGNSIKGSGPHFVAEKVEGETYDYMLKINTEGVTDQITTCLLRSDKKDVPAQMLKGVSSPTIENGNFKFVGVYKTNDELPELAEGYQIAYRIKVYHYTSASSQAYNRVDEFYTLTEDFDCANIQEMDKSYSYSISVTPFAAQVVDAETAQTKKTVDGKYLLVGNNSKFVDESFALIGFEETYGNQRIKKTEQPLEVQVSGASLEIRYSTSLDANNIGFCVYDGTGRLLTAESVQTNNDTHDNNAYKKALWTPAKDQLLYGPAYNLSVRIFNTGVQNSFDQPTYIMSNEKELPSEVYKLKSLSTDDISLTFDPKSETYMLNFDQYFENYPILNHKEYMQIELSFKSGAQTLGTLEITNDKTSFEFVVGEFKLAQRDDEKNQLPQNTTIGFVVKPTGSFTTGYIFDSDPCEDITLTGSAFGQEDGIEWNSQDLMYTWTLKGQDLTGKEFVVMLEINSNGLQTQEISDIITAQDESGLYYQPRNTGLITSAKVYVRSGRLGLFSSPLTYSEQVDFRLFASGTGVSGDPFVIENETQFRNIEKRNRQDQSYYFKLGKGLSLSLSEPILSQPFYGHLDGNGQTVILNISQTQTLKKTLSLNLPNGTQSTQSTSFEQGISLFDQIASSGEVKNLKLSTNVTLTSLNANSVIAPLVMTNYGTVSGVEQTNLSVTFASATRCTLAIAGLVGENIGINSNVGKIADCYNLANVDITLPRMGASVDLIYGGIALSSSGINSRIEHCFSEKDVKISTKINNSSISAAGIVCALMNNSKVQYCGNDANIVIDGDSSISLKSAFIAGVALRSNESTISLCYNNGVATASIMKDFSYAGICYLTNSSSLTKLVDTSGSSIALNGAVGNGKVEQCYATKKTSFFQSNESDLSQTTLQDGQYKLLIESKEQNKFTARIESNLS